MIEFKPQFVTVEDFDSYHHLDLRAMLRSYFGNESYAAEKFLAQTELKLMAWIDTTTFRRIPWCALNPQQKLYFQLAILEQAYYRYKNGDIGLDSGYDQEKGIVASRNDLKKIKVSDNAIDFLKSAGLYNLVVKNRPRTFSGMASDLNKFNGN